MSDPRETIADRIAHLKRVCEDGRYSDALVGSIARQYLPLIFTERDGTETALAAARADVERLTKALERAREWISGAAEYGPGDDPDSEDRKVLSEIAAALQTTGDEHDR